MSLELWFGFVAASTLLLVSPGQIVLFTVGSVLARGAGAILPIMLGTMLGDAVGLSFSLLGVGALVTQWPELAGSVRLVAGGVVGLLGVLGWRRSASQASNEPPRDASKSLGAAAFAMTALHPMGIVFFAAFIPAFTNASAPLLPQWLLLAGAFLVLSMLNILVWGLAADRARRLVSPRRQAMMNRAAALVMIAVGLMVMVSAV